jgi:hypothetical protein
MSDRQRTPRRLRALAAAALAVVLACGALLLGAGPAAAAPSLLCLDSVTCNPGNLPLLIDAGIVSGTAATGAAATTAATEGVAAFTVSTPTLVAGAFLAVGAAVTSGVMTQDGIPSSTTIKTQPSTGPGGGSPYGQVCSVAHPSWCATYLGVAHHGTSTTIWDWCYSITSGTALAITQWDTGGVGNNTSNFMANTTGNGCSIAYPSSVFTSKLGSSTNSQIGCYYFADQWGGGPTHEASPCPSTQAVGPVGWHGTIRSTVHCVGPGGTSHDVVATAAVDESNGATLHAPVATCDPGEIASTATVDFANTITPTTWIPLVAGTTPGDVVSLVDTYPDCFGPGVTPCKMQLYKVNGTAPATCGPNATFCVDWASDPTATDDYLCRYGSYTLDLSYCSMFRSPSVGPLPNYDLATSTPLPITEPVPATLPNQLTDPGTGDDAALPLPGDDTGADSASCWPSGWGVFNPAAWVLQPIQCAFKWAFVPDTAVIEADTAQVQEDWAETPPGQVIAAVSGWAFITPSAGCSGITIDVAWLFGGGTHTITVMQACPGDMLAPMAGWARIFCDLAFVVYSVVAVTRYVGGIFGFPGLGKEEAG